MGCSSSSSTDRAGRACWMFNRSARNNSWYSDLWSLVTTNLPRRSRCWRGALDAFSKNISRVGKSNIRICSWSARRGAGRATRLSGSYCRSFPKRASPPRRRLRSLRSWRSLSLQTWSRRHWMSSNLPRSIDRRSMCFWTTCETHMTAQMGSEAARIRRRRDIPFVLRSWLRVRNLRPKLRSGNAAWNCFSRRRTSSRINIEGRFQNWAQ